MSAIRVLLVDDQPLLRTGFRMILGATEDITVVGEAADGRSALAQVATCHPDVVLMDVRMPGMDGIEATGAIVASASRARVLVLTTFDVDEYAFSALRAGASGFLLKDVPPDELIGGDPLGGPRRRRRLAAHHARTARPLRRGAALRHRPRRGPAARLLPRWRR